MNSFIEKLKAPKDIPDQDSICRKWSRPKRKIQLPNPIPTELLRYGNSYFVKVKSKNGIPAYHKIAGKSFNDIHLPIQSCQVRKIVKYPIPQNLQELFCMDNSPSKKQLAKKSERCIKKITSFQKPIDIKKERNFIEKYSNFILTPLETPPAPESDSFEKPTKSISSKNLQQPKKTTQKNVIRCNPTKTLKTTSIKPKKLNNPPKKTVKKYLKEVIKAYEKYSRRKRLTNPKSTYYIDYNQKKSCVEKIYKKSPRKQKNETYRLSPRPPIQTNRSKNSKLPNYSKVDIQKSTPSNPRVFKWNNLDQK